MLLIILTTVSSCDHSGERPYYLDPVVSGQDTITLDTFNTIEMPPSNSPQEICFDLPDVSGVAVTGFVFSAQVKDGTIVSYTLTTTSKPPKKAETKKVSNSCSECYIIQKNDTKTSLARKFNIRQDQIQNATLKAGEKLIITN